MSDIEDFIRKTDKLAKETPKDISDFWKDVALTSTEAITPFLSLLFRIKFSPIPEDIKVQMISIQIAGLLMTLEKSVDNSFTLLSEIKKVLEEIDKTIVK